MDENERLQQQFWDEAATRFSRLVSSSEDAHYGMFGMPPAEKDLKLLGEIAGRKILVLGSGSGKSSIGLAKQGADVTAIDISSVQIKKSQALAAKQGTTVTFLTASFNDLSGFNDAQFDSVFSSYALQYTDQLDKVFGHVARLLKPEGRFGFSVDHPDYMALDHDTMTFEPDFKEGWHDIIVPWFKNAPLTVYRRHADTIETSLRQAGLQIDARHEDQNELIAFGAIRNGCVDMEHKQTTLIYGARKPAPLPGQ
jgi:ubiquinone/menaquinone biosynthesis C-methylase UbiE